MNWKSQSCLNAFRGKIIEPYHFLYFFRMKIRKITSIFYVLLLFFCVSCFRIYIAQHFVRSFMFYTYICRDIKKKVHNRKIENHFGQRNGLLITDDGRQSFLIWKDSRKKGKTFCLGQKSLFNKIQNKIWIISNITMTKMVAAIVLFGIEISVMSSSKIRISLDFDAAKSII